MTDFETYVTTELPLRPALIKGAAEATGNPNLSAVSKVQNAPIGTLYLQDDPSPKVLWQRFDAGVATWYPISSSFGTDPPPREVHVDATSVIGTETGSRYYPYTDFATAFADVTGSGWTIYIHSDVDILANTVIDATTNICFLAESMLSVAAGISLTINGNVIAPRQQIFDLAAGASVTGLQEAMAEWFGLDESATSQENADAIQAAFDSIDSGGIVTMGEGSFDVKTDVVTFPSQKPFQFLGAGADVVFSVATHITADGAGKLFQGSFLRSIRVANMKLDGNTNTDASHLIYIDSAWFSTFENLYFIDAAGIGFYATTSLANGGFYLNRLENINFYRCGGNGLRIEPHAIGYAATSIISRCRASNCGKTDATKREGFYLYGLYNSIIQDCLIEYNRDGHGLYADQCIRLVIIGGSYEHNGEDVADPTLIYQIYFTTNPGGFGCMIIQANYVTVKRTGPPPVEGGAFFLNPSQGQVVFDRTVEWLDGWSSPGTAWYNQYFQGGILLAAEGAYEIFGTLDLTSGDDYPRIAMTTDGKLVWREPATAVPDVELYRTVENSQPILFDTAIMMAGGGFMDRQYQNLTANGNLTLSDSYSLFYLWLNGNLVLTFPAVVSGKMIVLAVRQGNPARTLTFPANVEFNNGTYALTTTVNKMDVLKFQYVDTYGKWCEVSRSINLA